MDAENKRSVEMFRPPVDRTMRVLERSFFRKQLTLSAARVFDNNNLNPLRKTLGQEILLAERLQSIRPSPVAADQPLNRKAILLRPEIRPEERSTWTSTLLKLQEDKVLTVVPFDLTLDYDYWTYDDIMQAILPLDEHNEIPSGFSQAGHVAHLNLRSQYLPYKNLIAEVLVDKNPSVKTVINKIDDVGAEDEFRTFKYEVLKGDPSLVVEVRESDCVFRFDWAKVYWNQRLHTEHERLIKLFQPGEAVCDAMAGIGPFAIPAAKRKVFCWANDLNPSAYEAMKDNMVRNKVAGYLKPFNTDGRKFIRDSAQQLLEDDLKVEIKSKVKRSDTGPRPPSQYHVQPKTFQHYVMNLPASATEFLDAFQGLYTGQEAVFAPDSGRQLPMIHVYCFAVKNENNTEAELAICEELSRRLNHKMELGRDELSIHDVRDVAPKKRMFCASFRLPAEVSFRKL